MPFTLQLLDGTGAFNDTGLEELVRRVRLEKQGVSFKVVGIMGAQSSGKSLLLNELFGTSFRVMDASKGRGQTTQGVWLAKAEKMTRCTLVMDLEGSDGAERGEDGTLFERQIALFGLAVTDILIINLWNNDIGREKAAGKPLLRIIFDVMRRMFEARTMTLMFVIRDMSRQTTIEVMKEGLLKDLQKIWDEASESGKHKHSPVENTFKVIVKSLPNYEERKDEFAEQVTDLRMFFENLAKDDTRTEPGAVFSRSTQEIWRSIKENKVLDIPELMYMVSAYRCDEIAKQKLKALKSDIMSLLSQEGDTTNAIEGFLEVVDAKFTKCLDEFMAETEYMHEDCRTTKRNDLIYDVSKVVWPVYLRQIKRHQSQTLSEFRSGFDRRIQSGGRMRGFLHNAQEAALHSFDRKCEDSKVEHLQLTLSDGDNIKELKEELSRDIGTYVKMSQNAKLETLTSSSKKRLEDSVSKHISALLAEAGKSKSTSDIWSAIRSVLKSEVEKARYELLKEIRLDFDPTDEEDCNLSESLKLHGRGTVKTKVMSEKHRALDLMSMKFRDVFMRDEDGATRKSRSLDIRAVNYAAKLSALRFLSVLSAIRLNEEVAGNNADSIDVETLSRLVLRPLPFLERVGGLFRSGSESPQAQRDEALVELSKKSQWLNVTECDTVITPLEFKATWLKFEKQIQGDIEKAKVDKDNAGWGKTVKDGVKIGMVVPAVAATATAVAVAVPVAVVVATL